MLVSRAGNNRRYFKPGIASTLALLLAAPLLAGLGYWQLQRAAQKESIIAQWGEAKLADPVDISARYRASDLHLKRVRLRCELDGQRQLLLDNRVYRQRVGYEVLTACFLGEGVAVLLNRGWVAAPPKREQLPNVTLNRTYPAQFSGYFAIPGVGFSLGEALDATGDSWPRRVQYYDYRAISAALSVSLLEGIVYLDAESPLALVHNWRPIAFGPEKHYGYAFQWFALLATTLVLYAMLRKR